MKMIFFVFLDFVLGVVGPSQPVTCVVGSVDGDNCGSEETGLNELSSGCSASNSAPQLGQFLDSAGLTDSQ
jgi:hypothetical protein